jgi:spore coat polysaccharide biosynthesis predicted glycosyltransferase SpsG
MNRIIIYTEGGFYLGLGNIYRMMELAKSLVKKKPELKVTFATSSENYVIELIQNNGFVVRHAQIETLPDWISTQNFKILIIDKLNIEETFVQKIRNNKREDFKIVIFGNLSSANNISDLVINAIIGTDFSNNDYVDEFGTRYLTGPKYLTLRDEFIHHAYDYKNECKNILLLFGGTDQANYSCKVLEDLLHASIQYNITLVIGKGYTYYDELESILNNAQNIKILKDIKNVNEVMLANDFLITSPGTALFEGLYLGLPCLALYQNESQKKVFGDFFMTKSYEDIKNLSEYIQKVYDDFENYLERIDKFEVGRGKDEIINQIIELI